MTNIKDELEKDSKKFEKQLESFDTKKLEELVGDDSVALQYAREGILQNEHGNLSDEYVQAAANEMQTVAKMILKERSVN